MSEKRSAPRDAATPRGRRDAKQAGQAAALQWSQVFDAISDSVCVLGLDGRILQANAAMARQFGGAAGTVQGETCCRAVHGVSGPIEHCPFQRMKESRSRETLEAVQGARWLLITADPLFDAEGRLAAAVHIISDITERKRAEQALQSLNAEVARSNAELERFGYSVSHDLKEPLRMIASYTSLLAKRYGGQLDEDGREFLGFAREGAERLQLMIDDLLSYSRVTTRGRAFEPVPLGEALDEALKNLAVALEESRATVVRDALPTVPGDRGQLVQLFQNLVGNAAKFRRPGEPPRIAVTARAGGLAGTGWTVSVQDNGIGIDPKDFERIFVVFQKLHAREEYPGSGVGLAICKKIVERHGGRIWVESTVGAGSTFLFTLLPER